MSPPEVTCAAAAAPPDVSITLIVPKPSVVAVTTISKSLVAAELNFKIESEVFITTEAKAAPSIALLIARVPELVTTKASSVPLNVALAPALTVTVPNSSEPAAPIASLKVTPAVLETIISPSTEPGIPPFKSNKPFSASTLTTSRD